MEPFFQEIYTLVFKEIKRRLSILQLPNQQKLLAKMGVKPQTADKFDRDFALDAKE